MTNAIRKEGVCGLMQPLTVGHMTESWDVFSMQVASQGDTGMRLDIQDQGPGNNKPPSPTEESSFDKY